MLSTKLDWDNSKYNPIMSKKSIFKTWTFLNHPWFGLGWVIFILRWFEFMEVSLKLLYKSKILLCGSKKLLISVNFN